MLTVVGNRTPGTGVTPAAFQSDLVWQNSDHGRTHQSIEGGGARPTLRTYRVVITDTTPFAPRSGAGVGEKSDGVLDGTPVAVSDVTVPKHPYMLVGMFGPARASAGEMPVEWVREWTITCPDIYSRTPMGGEVNSVGEWSGPSIEDMGGDDGAGPLPGVFPT